MRDSILILSRCLSKCTSKNSHSNYTKFHFIGYYNGHKIREINLRHNFDNKFESNEDYLLWVKFIKIEEGKLICSPLKVKKL